MPDADHPARLRIFLPPALICALALMLAPLRAQTAQSPAEQYVLTQLSQHGSADLGKSGLPEKQWVLSHDFLEDLITNPTPPPAIQTHGIWITRATINGELVISNATIPFPLTFDHCYFPSGFDLSSNTFNRNFMLTASRVGSPSKQDEPEATFKGDRFDGEVSIDQTKFLNEFDFSDVEIAGAFESHDTSFESADDEADFTDVQVRKESSFQSVTFNGNLDLTSADLAELSISGNSSSGSPVPPLDLNLTNAHVKKGLSITSLTLSGFGATSAVVQSGALLKDVTLSGPVLLNDSQFASLALSGFPQWKAQAKNSRFDGFSFQSISIDGDSTKALRLLEVLNRSRYNPQPYLALEKYLRSSGNVDDADEVYFDMRKRGRAQMDPFDWFLDWIQDVLVGYGRQTWKAALYALLLIVAGAFLFTRKRMEPEDQCSADAWYNPFWFSLDLLSPIDLGVAKNWRPSRPVLRNYAQIHRVSGWILLPLIAAAITGIIK